MPRVIVYHSDRMDPDAERPAREFPSGYTAVAEVVVDYRGRDSLVEVMHLTQHGHRLWWENGGVKLRVSPRRLRSTSVGDVLVSPSGRPYRIAPIGFEGLR